MYKGRSLLRRTYGLNFTSYRFHCFLTIMLLRCIFSVWLCRPFVSIRDSCFVCLLSFAILDTEVFRYSSKNVTNCRAFTLLYYEYTELYWRITYMYIGITFYIKKNRSEPAISIVRSILFYNVTQMFLIWCIN